MAAIAKKLNRKTLILAHREELITQAVDKFRLFWPGVDIGICMADKNEITCQIVVGSIQSCYRPQRLTKLKEQGFELLLIDEAHHSASESYQSVINGLGFNEEAEKLLVGVTATPQRSDNYGLGNIFQDVTFSRSIATMIKAGYLSPVVGRKILTNLSFEKISVQNGDFALGELSELVNTSERNQFVVGKFLEYACDRRTVAFCVDVRHCQDLAIAFQAQGVNCQAVWGDMIPEDRKRALDDFKHGRIQVLTSCGILTEGYDETSISCVAMTRPTKSQSLYIQCIGRGLRIHPGKENCLVLDFSDRGHSLDSALSLSTIIPEVAEVKEEVDPNDIENQEKEDIDRSPKINVIEKLDAEFDILGSAKFVWIPIGDDEWSLLDDNKAEIVLKPTESGYIATLYAADGAERQIVKTPLPLAYAQGVAEDYARKHLKVAFADLSQPWMQVAAHPTEGQKEYLKKKDAWRDGISKAQASLAIREIITKQNKQRRALGAEPITGPQTYFLKSRGVETANMSKLEAMREIAKLKQRA